MPLLHLVRHGRAAAAWDVDPDPGLDAEGRAQAETAARLLAPRGPLALYSSPLRRTRETAAPLAQAWALEPRLEPRVGEIPSPTADLAARGAWLADIAGRDWSALDDGLRRWRADLLAALAGMSVDAVVFTHFVAINAAVGAATGRDRVVHFRPGYCSITTLRVAAGRLILVERGSEADTRVL